VLVGALNVIGGVTALAVGNAAGLVGLVNSGSHEGRAEERLQLSLAGLVKSSNTTATLRTHALVLTASGS
jgi:hypothetical protein